MSLALNWQAAANPPAAAHIISEPTGTALALVGIFACFVLRGMANLGMATRVPGGFIIAVTPMMACPAIYETERSNQIWESESRLYPF